ncbi:unnamed protein product [Gongylonema pulchrum]|uniref:G_PROTEIN_RECEP_F1_2 domain-containing protein n=1 Tax=Gongylonema pulchrum TaxID=637853 RepID=A0A183DPR6_9BILA|nr:unnamed protein product [Gongylonema pulchrum]
MSNNGVNLQTGVETDGGELAFQRTDDGGIQMPSLIATDYMEIVILSIVLIVGLPLNGFVLYRLFKQYFVESGTNRYKRYDARLRFLMLKMHLTLIDLAFIVLYCPSKLIWKIKCREFLFIIFPSKSYCCRMFVHHSMSFAIVCIAIDRVKTVFDMMEMKKRGRLASSSHRLGCTKACCLFKMIILTYLAAAVFSTPQWFVWTTADLNSWAQCTTIWHKIRAQHFLSGSNEVEYTFIGEQIYTIVHLITMFWGPIVVLIISYTCIAIITIFYTARQPFSSSTSLITKPSSMVELSEKLVFF